MSKSSHQVPNTDVPTTSLGESEYHRLLADKRRRLTLMILTERNHPHSLESLGASVAVRESEIDDADPRAVKQVQTTLHHIHLPKLADAGVVDYDLDRQRVSLVDSAE